MIVMIYEKGDNVSEEVYLLWLSMLPKVNNIKKFKLLKIFKSAQNIYYANYDDFKFLGFLKTNEIDNIIKHKSFDIENYLNKLKENNISFYSFFSEYYPEKLRDIDTPPFVVYVKGKNIYNNSNVITVVGSRRCTEYGKRVAYELSKDLAKKGVTILSGMAYGIDTFAHKGAVENGGSSIAVLGCSNDICYPKENEELKLKIETSGCTISEYPITTQPISRNFPIRNRIMAGMCDGLIVVEASQKSGTSITINNALDYGKNIFSVPGSIFNRCSFGTNELIKDGAVPITCADDVMSYLNIEDNNVINIKEDNEIPSIDLSDNEKEILKYITNNDVAVEYIINKTNFQTYEIQAILSMLEIKGVIKKLPGQRYIRK